MAQFFMTKCSGFMVCAKYVLILVSLEILFLPAVALGQAQTPKIQIHTGADPQALLNSSLQAFEKSEQEVVSYHLVLSDEQSEGKMLQRAFSSHTPLPHTRDSRTRASEPSTNAGGLVGDRLRALQQALGDAQNSLTVLEGNSKTFDINLDFQPSGTVTGIITGHGNTDLSVSPTQLTFDDTNWNVLRTITVTANQDSDDTDENVKLTLTLSGNSITNPRDEDIQHITILDDDRPWELVPWEILEGSGAIRRIPLLPALAPPSGDVTFTITGHVNTKLTLDKTTLTFPQNQWDVSQPLGLGSTPDIVNADEHITLTFTALGGGYTGLQYTVDVTILDRPPYERLVPEGAAASYTSYIQAELLPIADLIGTLTGHKNTDLTVNPEQLTFKKNTWRRCGTDSDGDPLYCSDRVSTTLTAADDTDDVDDQVVLLLTVAGGGGGISGCEPYDSCKD